MVAKRLRVRQDSASPTASSSRTSYPQPTMTIALSTTFTPAASCASNKLTMLPPPGYFIWANEPVPFQNTTVTNCYPSEFLKGYTSVASGLDQSSVVPVMSPLVCPSNFCVQFVGDDNYMACCPSGYLFAPPKTPLVRDRPGYGGTCYSDFTVSSTATVLKYDESGSTMVAPFVATTSLAQAFAHPIDGFAPNAPKLGCASPSPSPSPSSSLSSSNLSSRISAPSSASTSSTAASGSTGVSPGVIAGAVVGSVLGLIAIVGLVLFLLRRRHAQKSGQQQDVHQLDDGFVQRRPEEMAAIPKSDKYAHIDEAGGHGIHEMNAEPVHELSGVNKTAWPSDKKYVDRS
ncbi:hypothetical protein CC86DRAFT_11882 [Ophiobolus disseminans]|uniref:Uncharacterized protein n=1 Tax=Ophiobolus disseminans TaxID=1469910 RepID=A0A6A7AJW8_9PLEO|nr:hypothetical protein CC86DRAFT_11882 [Ophiobolus disseminans]